MLLNLGHEQEMVRHQYCLEGMLKVIFAILKSQRRPYTGTAICEFKNLGSLFISTWGAKSERNRHDHKDLVFTKLPALFKYRHSYTKNAKSVIEMK